VVLLWKQAVPPRKLMKETSGSASPVTILGAYLPQTTQYRNNSIHIFHSQTGSASRTQETFGSETVIPFMPYSPVTMMQNYYYCYDYYICIYMFTFLYFILGNVFHFSN
jgi:hypothetical protein